MQTVEECIAKPEQYYKVISPESNLRVGQVVRFDPKGSMPGEQSYARYWLRGLDGAETFNAKAVPRGPYFEALTEEQFEALRVAEQVYCQANTPGVLHHVPYSHNTTGTDPELFVEDAQGKVIPAWEFLPSKADSLQTCALNGAYWDGFQAELRVFPRQCHQQLVDCIWLGLKDLQKRLKGRGKLSFKTVVEIPGEVLQAAPDPFVALGCGGSYNAYGLYGQPAGNPRELVHRFSGGHIHYEVPRVLKTPKLVERVISAVDMVAGIPSLLMFQKLDNPIRRMYYGLPGEYRIPEHGLEYRFLSSAWMSHPATAGFTLGLVRLGFTVGLRQFEWMFKYDPEAVPRILMTGDLDEAKKHVERNKEPYKAFFEVMSQRALREEQFDINKYQNRLVDASYDQLLRPIGDFVPLVSMEENWSLREGEKWVTQARGRGKQWQSLVIGKTYGEGVPGYSPRLLSPE